MEEIIGKLNKEVRFDFFRNVTNPLIVGLLCIFAFWYIQYHWNRRRLYKMAAKINGPAPVPFLGNALLTACPKDEILGNISRLCLKYDSPTRLWFGPELIFLIREPKDAGLIFTKALQKADSYRFAEHYLGTGLFTAPVPKWRKHKKIITPMFNQKVLNGFVDIFAEKSAILTEQLNCVAGTGTVDIFDYLIRCTLDIICGTAMGVNIDAQTTDCEYNTWIRTALEALDSRLYTLWYQYDFFYKKTKLCQEEAYALDKIHEFSDAVIKKCRTAYKNQSRKIKEESEYDKDESVKRTSILQQLIELSESDGERTDREIRDEIDTLVTAGSDTTASTMCYVLMVLGMFPDIQEKVYQEVTEAIGRNGTVKYHDLKNMEYLERVINETLRLFPTSGFIGRAVTEDIKLDKCTVPSGSSVSIMVILLHRNPDIWSNPLKFDPDRFLPEQVAKRLPYSWIPFSGSPRNCVGIRYATMSMKSTVAALIQKYQFISDYKAIEDVKLKMEFTVKPSDGYKVSLKLRD